MKLSFSSYCESLGVPLHNRYWSWCACEPNDGVALFTIWEDQIQNGRYVFTTTPRAGESPRKPGRSELISVLQQVVDGGFASYGIQCRAADINAVPRKRKSFISDHLLDLRVRRQGDSFVGQIVGQIPPMVVIARGNQSAWVASTAINDIDQDVIGNDDPEYQRRMSGNYVRDNNVREGVLKRAHGICEFCGEAGFPKRDGGAYLETHHIISLSQQGVDRPDNVIALCANDHRRAHFGRDWIELQEQFLAILKSNKAGH